MWRSLVPVIAGVKQNVAVYVKILQRLTAICFFPCSIRQYELKVHTDINMNKVYTGEIGRLNSFEVQKP